MIKRFFIYLIIFFIPFLLTAQIRDKELNKNKGKFREAVRLPFHFLRLALKKVDVCEFKEYSYGNHKRQYMLVYQPLNTESRTDDIVFFFHGGGWHVGSPEQNRYLAALLTSYGYTAIIPAYRLGPKYCYEDIQADIDSVIVRGLEILDSYNSENRNLIFGGTSAGGHLAALLAYDNVRLKRLGLDSKRIKGFFAIASPLDLDLMADSKVLHAYAGDPEMVTFQMANPINLVDKNDNFPALFLHSKQDGIVDYRATLSFEKHMRYHGLSPEVKLFEDLSHIEMTSAWYYKEKVNLNQGELLQFWLLGLD